MDTFFFDQGGAEFHWQTRRQRKTSETLLPKLTASAAQLKREPAHDSLFEESKYNSKFILGELAVYLEVIYTHQQEHFDSELYSVLSCKLADLLTHKDVLKNEVLSRMTSQTSQKSVLQTVQSGTISDFDPDAPSLLPQQSMASVKSKDSGLATDTERAVSRQNTEANRMVSILKKPGKNTDDSSKSGNSNSKKTIESSSKATPSKAGRRISMSEPSNEIKATATAPPLTAPSISFSIANRSCHDKGWVSYNGDSLEQETMLIWARARLQRAIKLKNEEDVEEHRFNHHHSKWTTVYYTAPSNKKIPSKKQKLFRLSRAKDCTFVYYPSGACALASFDSLFFVYSNLPSRLMAHFQASGVGACFHANGQQLFVSTPTTGYCFDESGKLLRKWRWQKHTKIIPPLSIKLNENITFRCSNKENMLLIVNIKNRTTKVKVTQQTTPDPSLVSVNTVPSRSYSPALSVQLSRSSYQTSECSINHSKSVFTTTSSSLKKDSSISIDENQHLNALKKIKQKSKRTIDDWLRYYRLASGIKSPLSSPESRRNAKLSPNKQSGGYYEKSSLRENTLKLSDGERALSRRCELRSRPKSSAGEYNRRSVSPDYQMPHSKSVVMPFKCGLPNKMVKEKRMFPKRGCPIALRQDILGTVGSHCRCDKRNVPVLSDVEYDQFLTYLPKTQLLVVSVVSCEEVDDVISVIYRQLHARRILPCAQSRDDPFRLARYKMSEDGGCLLVRRHNISPGMFLMYEGGKLLFADFVFNGYDQTKKSLLKQIRKSRKDALRGRYLPEDFRFTDYTPLLKRDVISDIPTYHHHAPVSPPTSFIPDVRIERGDSVLFDLPSKQQFSNKLDSTNKLLRRVSLQQH